MATKSLNNFHSNISKNVVEKCVIWMVRLNGGNICEVTKSGGTHYLQISQYYRVLSYSAEVDIRDRVL